MLNLILNKSIKNIKRANINMKTNPMQSIINEPISINKGEGVYILDFCK